MRRKIKITASGILIFFCAALAVLALWPVHPDTLDRPCSPVVTDKHGKPLRIFLSPDDKWRFYVHFSEISPVLIDTVTCYEDRFFYSHPGVNPLALARAFWQNLRRGHVVSGGSTITMQIARMSDPKKRTYLNKLKEIITALRLEMKYSKQELLEIYFNLAPYGGNIEGVGAATWLYLGKAPGKLSLAEAALLASIPQSPEKNRPDKFPKMSLEARNKVLQRLLEMGKISKQEFRDASTREVPFQRQPVPCMAPHLSRLLATRHPNQHRIHSTIDSKIQALAREKLRSHIERLRQKGITNGAVVVIENRTRTVRAMVGSYDFFDKSNSGQVNGALAPRSPGSTLKPFLYARALDMGVISPQMLIPDVPMQYGGYSPENYDGKYNGMVTMRQALIRSLNVPPVNLQARLGNDGIFHVLKKVEMSTIKGGREYYGLSIILGGCEITLLELTNLYATLADRGRFRMARIREDEPPEPFIQVFSPAAAYIITDILANLRRPDLPDIWEAAVNIPLIAWKTGTSYGRHDAWSIGYNPQYTVGVWTGNFSGKAVPELVGSQAAGPLLMDIFNALAKETNNTWFTRPPQVGKRMVCALSGMSPGPDCEHLKSELYIRNVSPTKTCNFHRRFDIDDKTGYRLCSHCRVGRDYHSELFVVWPRGVATWMIQNGIPVDEIPRHFPDCTRVSSHKPPVIRSPQAGGLYLIRPGISLEDQKISLLSSVANNIKKVFWFVDGQLLWSGPPTEKVFYLPERGRHSFVCMDEEGRRSKITIRVE
jgi:penicillin-binding protein 1C